MESRLNVLPAIENTPAHLSPFLRHAPKPTWYMDSPEDNFVTYGEPFDEEDANKSNFLHPKVRPQAYEKRVLNERGRPMRFHGAFTGGFSAGYFNTVGSKEGFKPQSFKSSRRNRDQNADQTKVAQPEEFMDEEDLGEFGIAPRHFRTNREYDDRHIFTTLSEFLGGKSVIPDANDILKRMLIPCGTSLADRLLRRMGWKSDEVAAVTLSDTYETENDSSIEQEKPKELDYAIISFAPKANTFGLGYSGLNPEIALGREAPNSALDPQSESVGALKQRESAFSGQGFNPGEGPIRQGIRGQAFGVGALHTEDADIYAQESLSAYDFSIGVEENVKCVGEGEDEDDEMAELEAARHGRFSDLRRGQTKKSGFLGARKTIDGWTPPTLSKISISGREEDPDSDIIEGFVAPADKAASSLVLTTQSEFFVMPKAVILPPGYNPVFNPACLGQPPAEPPSDLRKGDSVFRLLRPEDKRRLEEKASGLLNVSAAGAVAAARPLLKPFTSDSAKQARFESYQLLIRRGISHDEAYSRCSKDCPDLAEESSKFEASLFATLLKNLASMPPPPAPDAAIGAQPPMRTQRPLTSGILPSDKHRLVANLLKSRFRSAGEMDVTKELTKAEEEARRRDIEALDMTDPRDNAAANDSYGVLTRNKLIWHPAALLCKRVNVPNPYPDSTFMGCPEDRRLNRPPRRVGKRGRKGVDAASIVGGGENFTLFQLLDVNVGSGEAPDEEEFTDSEEEDGEGVDVPNEGALTTTGEEETAAQTPASSISYSSAPMVKSPGAPASIFDALFQAAASAEGAAKNKPAAQKIEEPDQRVIGPSAPPVPAVPMPQVPDDVVSMDLFKSIFASDEEPEDTEEEEDEEPPISAPIAADFRPSVVSQDVGYRFDDSPIHQTDTALTSLRTTDPPAVDLATHHLFKHLFNPSMDTEAPLFAINAVAQQKRDPKILTAPGGDDDDHDPYGPSLPPDFQGGPPLSSSITNYASPAPPDELEYVPRHRDKHHKDKNRSGKEKHSHKHHKHKHKRSSDE